MKWNGGCQGLGEMSVKEYKLLVLQEQYVLEMH